LPQRPGLAGRDRHDEREVAAALTWWRWAIGSHPSPARRSIETRTGPAGGRPVKVSSSRIQIGLAAIIGSSVKVDQSVMRAHPTRCDVHGPAPR
jgi:hypothetical protein